MGSRAIHICLPAITPTGSSTPGAGRNRSDFPALLGQWASGHLHRSKQSRSIAFCWRPRGKGQVWWWIPCRGARGWPWGIGVTSSQSSRRSKAAPSSDTHSWLQNTALVRGKCSWHLFIQASSLDLVCVLHSKDPGQAEPRVPPRTCPTSGCHSQATAQSSKISQRVPPPSLAGGGSTICRWKLPAIKTLLASQGSPLPLSMSSGLYVLSLALSDVGAPAGMVSLATTLSSP